MMKKFVIHVFFFCAPLLLFAIPPFLALKISRENYFEIDNVVTRKKKYLIGYAYNEPNYGYLKWKEVTSKPKQNILAVGSSRILQFRANMFQSGFYNAGYTITSISEFVPFLKSIPKSKYPEILIVNLDQWMFNKRSDSLSDGNLIDKWKNSFRKNASATTLNNVWQDLLTGKYGYVSLLKTSGEKGLEKIGLNAAVHDKGFRNDGSIFYGDQITKLINNNSTANDYHYNDTYKRIAAGNNKFEYASEVNPKALFELDNFLKFCAINNIYVVGFLPPYANKVNEKMKQSGNYSYMSKIYPASVSIFKKYGFELWDMTLLSKCGSDDRETIDGFHGGEVTYQKILIYMIENNSRLKDYTSLIKLQSDLKHKLNNYIVYGY
jgi:hypothetical protein